MCIQPFRVLADLSHSNFHFLRIAHTESSILITLGTSSMGTIFQCSCFWWVINFLIISLRNYFLSGCFIAWCRYMTSPTVVFIVIGSILCSISHYFHGSNISASSDVLLIASFLFCQGISCSWISNHRCVLLLSFCHILLEVVPAIAGFKLPFTFDHDIFLLLDLRAKLHAWRC